MTDYDFAALPHRHKAVRPLTAFEEGERDGKLARASGSYTLEDRQRFINANRHDSDRYTQGFIAGLLT